MAIPQSFAVKPLLEDGSQAKQENVTFVHSK